MKIGVVLDGRRSASEIAELARLAEANGILHFWLSGGARTKDHFLRLALAATTTKQIQVGPIAISPFEMHPARIGISLLTLDEITNGRASIVLGGGGDFAATLGLYLTDRVSSVEETIDIIRAIAQGGEVNYLGKHYKVNGLFSPWPPRRAPLLYVGANRPKMIRMAAEKADGIMVTDMPLAYIKTLIDQVLSVLLQAGRDPKKVRISNWFVWNIQETKEEAFQLARRQLGFRLYYIRDLAASIGVSEAEAIELERKQPAMLRAIFQGKEYELHQKNLEDLLIEHLTITADRRNINTAIERLLEFEKLGLNEIALALHGDPVAAIKQLGKEVVPTVQREFN